MTIQEAISSFDELEHNTGSTGEKIQQLSELDWRIVSLIYNPLGKNVDFNGYDDDTPMDTMLLAPAPFDSMYQVWLEAKMHYINEEYDRYNNAMAMFNRYFEDYAAFCLRGEKPAGGRWMM